MVRTKIFLTEKNSQARTRTWDMIVNSDPLYQLSYLGKFFIEKFSPPTLWWRKYYLIMLSKTLRPLPDFKKHSRFSAKVLLLNSSLRTNSKGLWARVQAVEPELCSASLSSAL